MYYIPDTLVVSCNLIKLFHKLYKVDAITKNAFKHLLPKKLPRSINILHPLSETHRAMLITH